MQRTVLNFMTACSLLVLAGAAHADDIEGVIDHVDAANRTVTVQGIVFLVTPETDFDDGLKRFEDLRNGQRIEVDFEYRDGRHVATEIELED